MLGCRERLVVKEQGLDLKCEGRQGPQQEREGVGFPGQEHRRQPRQARSQHHLGSRGRHGLIASSIMLRRNPILKAAGSHVRVGNGEQ